MHIAQLNDWMIDWIVHRESDGIDRLEFAEGAPDGNPERICTAVISRGRVRYERITRTAGNVAKTGTDEQKRDFFKKVASNPNVFNRELRFEPRGAWQLVVDQGSFAHSTIAASCDAAIFAGETHPDVLKRRGGDSLPMPAPQCADLPDIDFNAISQPVKETAPARFTHK